MKIAVLIPCYNEEITIEKVIKDFRAKLPKADIYVYDNNSTDCTVEIATKAGAIIGYEHKQGKGNVIKRMFNEIEADCYIMVDGDDTYPPDDVDKMIELIEQGADMVIGDRLSSTYFTENKRPFHNVGNVTVRFLVNKLFKGNVMDIMTGLRAFSKDFVKNFPCKSTGFQLETEMTAWALAHGRRIENVVIQYRDRPAGSVSKLSTVKDGLKVIGMILRLKWEYMWEK